MISLSMTQAGELGDLAARAVAAASAASEEAARDLLDRQAAAAAAGVTPAGGAQRRNSAEWARAKGGRPPLVHTGRLSSPGAWVVERSPRSLRLLPPAARRRAVAVLQRRGYRTILDALPPGVVSRCSAAWRRAFERR